MFEGYVVYYLNQYLGKYVDGIDQKSLRCEGCPPRVALCRCCRCRCRLSSCACGLPLAWPSICRISIYKGDVVLKNLRLRPDALASLDLPVTVRAGLLGSLTLKVRHPCLSPPAPPNLAHVEISVRVASFCLCNNQT